MKSIEFDVITNEKLIINNINIPILHIQSYYDETIICNFDLNYIHPYHILSGLNFDTNSKCTGLLLLYRNHLISDILLVKNILPYMKKEIRENNRITKIIVYFRYRLDNSKIGNENEYILEFMNRNKEKILGNNLIELQKYLIKKN